MELSFFLLVALVASYLFTWLFRRYALAYSLFDVPNTRSSHLVPTPRGGGVGFVIVFIVVAVVLGLRGLVPLHAMTGLLGAGLVVAIVGFFDDHGDLAARSRLIFHFFSAGIALAWLDGLPPIKAFGIVLELSWLGYIVGALFLVWMLNLFNFMDGIDGLASLEAIAVCVGGAIVYMSYGDSVMAVLPALLAAVLIGFLVWNFPVARIFMGDVGSGFLGLIIGIFTLQAGWFNAEFLWTWLILAGVFIVDATYTLARRFFGGARVYEAHRTHAYQHAARKYGSHCKVTMAILGINLLWLWPLAFGVAAGVLEGVLALIVAYVPLLALTVKYKAGVTE